MSSDSADILDPTEGWRAAVLPADVLIWGRNWQAGAFLAFLAMTQNNDLEEARKGYPGLDPNGGPISIASLLRAETIYFCKLAVRYQPFQPRPFHEFLESVLAWRDGNRTSDVLERARTELELANLERDALFHRLAAANAFAGTDTGGTRIEECPRPRWDSDRLTLDYGETVCRHYKRRNAPNQFKVLSAFQTANWSRSIASPFGFADRTLSETIDEINRSLADDSPIRFGVEERRPIWVLRSPLPSSS